MQVLKSTFVAIVAASTLTIAGASLAQAHTSGQADLHSSNANQPGPAHQGKMMMKKKMHHKAM